MNDQIYEITIKDIIMLKAKNGRHGAKFILATYFPQSPIIFSHIFWLGNYKDFQSDFENKSRLLWDIFYDSIDRMNVNGDFLCDIRAKKLYLEQKFNSTLSLKQNQYFSAGESYEKQAKALLYLELKRIQLERI